MDSMACPLDAGARPRASLRLVSVLVPVYQEAPRVRALLERVRRVDASRTGFALEIIICDDGSTDATHAEALAFARSEPRARVVRHARNRGKGAAVRTALAHARGEYCLVQDADLEYDAADYPRLFAAAAAGARAVYGSRFARTPWPRGMRPANWVANRVLTALANALYGLRLTDEATCYKLVETELLRALALRSERFEFCPELTAKLGLRGVAITEVPIGYVARGAAEGKKIRWTDGVTAAWVLVHERLAAG